MPPISAKPGRRRGHQAGLDRQMILETALGMEQSSLTMQAIADRLGVNRKAVSYYFADRNQLLGSLAALRFSQEFAARPLKEASDWEEAIWVLAETTTASLLATGDLVGQLRFGPAMNMPGLEAADRAVKLLVAAGASDELAARTLIALADLCMGYARDSVDHDLRGRTDDDWYFERLLTDAPEELSTMRETRFHRHDLVQLDFNVRLVIGGVRSQLAPVG